MMVAVVVVRDAVMVVVVLDVERVRKDVRAQRDERGDGQYQGQSRVQRRSHIPLITEILESRK